MESDDELLVLAALLRRRKNKRRCWVKKINRRRTETGEFHNLVQEMRLYDEESFRTYFRMTRSQFDDMLRIVGPLIHHPDTNCRKAISPHERLAITLRFLSTGDSYQTIAFSYRCGKSTIATIVVETCNALWNILQPAVMTPPTAERWLEIADNFSRKWNFPNCIGAIDGKHVVIQAPAKSGSLYYNYKHSFSIIMLAACDANYCFTLMCVGSYGRESDGGVFSHSDIGKAMTNGMLNLPLPQNLPGTNQKIPWLFVGDEAFPLRHDLMRPFPGKQLPVDRRVFNYRLSRARRIIENTFGILANRWRIFRRPIACMPKKVEIFVKATTVLHNYLRLAEINSPFSERFYCPITYVDAEDTNGVLYQGRWREEESPGALLPVNRFGTNNFGRVPATIRDYLKDYFVSPNGSVPWQMASIYM